MRSSRPIRSRGRPRVAGTQSGVAIFYGKISAMSDAAVSSARERLDAHVREKLAAYKAPRIWVFVEEFPMTPSGKVQKFVLRDRLVAGELRAVEGAG